MADGNFNYSDTIKILLKNKEVDEGILLTCLDMTIQSILNYCNLNELPSALNLLVCKICAETIIELSISNDTAKIVGNVSSISEDGRTVSFTNGSEFKVSVDDKITHLKELNRYRKLFRI